MTLRRKTIWKFIAVCVFTFVVAVIAFPGLSKPVAPVHNAVNALRINLGLDLQGGLHVEYKMKLDDVDAEKIEDAKNAAQAVIERRVNAFGVGESSVYVAERGNDSFLVVEIPGIDNIEEAKDMIQQTPFLEFHEERSEQELAAIVAPQNEEARQTAQELLARVQTGEDFAALATEFSQDPGSAAQGGDLGFTQVGAFVPEFDAVIFESDLGDEQVYGDVVESAFGFHIIKKIEERTTEVPVINDAGEETEEKTKAREVRARHILIAKASANTLNEERFVKTTLTGEHLKSAAVDFSGGNQGGISTPQVALQFNGAGGDLFAEITERNVGKQVATFIDGELVTAPVIQQKITGGQAVITGNFTLDEAKDLAARLNEGALPVPIELVAQQSIDASLGKESLEKGLKAGLFGLFLTVVYMIFYYRILGLVAGIALTIYASAMIALFKLSVLLPSIFHVTLTLAGIAGLILSIGMAVDANILIFERMREELRAGRSLPLAINEGFKRAWTSIRDGNLSTIITSLILMWVGTGFVKGFALILILGVLFSMFTAIVLVRIIVTFGANDFMERNMHLILGNIEENTKEKAEKE